MAEEKRQGLLRRFQRSQPPDADPPGDADEAGTAAPAEPERDPGAPVHDDDRPPSWQFEDGAAIAPGRTVVQTLGGGNRYEVFLVWDDRLFALAVAKVLRPDAAQSSRALEELAEEAAALERLAHPVLVRGFDAVLEGELPHLLIEHLEGPTLRRLIRKHGAVPLEELLPLAAHVGAALHYMAAEGFLHLDVKPDNLVMGVPPRLIDLSIAQSFERAAGIRGALGTDAYMPPEQCIPSEYPGAIGPPADVWGLGATLHHCVSGGRPFPRASGARDSADPVVRFPQLVEEPQPLPDEAPAALRDLIARTLSKDPAGRPSAEEVVLALQPLVADLPRKLVFARSGTQFR